ncbi:heme-binding protein 2-like [Ylistrum balloti]|uniref:heme-binding protein 2-like n=1 Tax=Ylistrum balloti TaxID=509963 RepID=UPI002905DF21|nr:heme-binding protein 2-like [Ylistrum balloti]
MFKLKYLLRCRVFYSEYKARSNFLPVPQSAFTYTTQSKEPDMNVLNTIKSSFSSSGLETPTYTEGKKQDDVQERRYEAAKWVSTSVEGMELKKAQSEGFGRLFKYITGNNKPGTKVDMTAPVATRINPGAGPNCENTFTVSFYIPSKHQADPPEPSDPKVFIEEWPERTILCQGFGGFAKEETWLSHAKTLTGIVEERGEKVHSNFWFTAGYNSPFQMFGRTNEVWFVKDPQS